MEDKFDRVKSLIGIDKFNKLQSLSILIVGLGGVGGSVVEGLTRSGCNNLIIIDSDSINPSNLNRQVISNINNIGKLKTDATIELVKSINPLINIKAYSLFLDESNIDEIFKNKIDIIIDCIDSVKSKICLYKKALEYNIEIISSMGTANKIDPTKITLTTLDKTLVDPLARKIRTICKQEHIDMKKINVCYSLEESLTDLTNPLPSMMMVPTSAAMAIVSYVIKFSCNNK